MGLYDRNYMHSDRPHPVQGGRKMMMSLILVNVLVYFILGNSFALNWNGSFRIENLFQLFAAGFSHSDFWHLVFNMWGLYLFGSLIAPYMDGKRFLLLYLSGVIFGNVLFILCNIGNSAHLLGASGAVCAVMAAAATLEPERRFVMIFMPFSPLKTPTLVLCYTILEIIMLLGRVNTQVAHLAHLGGFLGGYVMMKIYFGSNLPWDPLRKLFPKKQFSRPQEEKKSSYSANKTASADTPVSPRELDYLLDKLSQTGINSLTEEEIERLRQARRQMRGE